MTSKLAKIKTTSLQPAQPCGAITKAGALCKHNALPGSSVCNSHKTPAQAASAIARAKFPGLYSRSLVGIRKEIADEVVAQGELLALRSTDIEDELALSRIELAQMLASNEYSAKQHLKAVETIARVASLAKKLKEMDNNAIKSEFVSAVIGAVTFAFHRANSISDPAERAIVFQREFMGFFPEVEGTPEPFSDGTINGEYTIMNGGVNDS